MVFSFASFPQCHVVDDWCFHDSCQSRGNHLPRLLSVPNCSASVNATFIVFSATGNGLSLPTTLAARLIGAPNPEEAVAFESLQVLFPHMFGIVVSMISVSFDFLYVCVRHFHRVQCNWKLSVVAHNSGGTDLMFVLTAVVELMLMPLARHLPTSSRRSPSPSARCCEDSLANIFVTPCVPLLPTQLRVSWWIRR